MGKRKHDQQGPQACTTIRIIPQVLRHPTRPRIKKVGVLETWDYSTITNRRHDPPLASLPCMPSRLSRDSGCAICRLRAGVPADAQHTRRRMSTDVVQVDPVVHCALQLACGVSALHSTTASDSCAVCERTCSWCDRMRPQLRSCVPALVGGVQWFTSCHCHPGP